MKRRLFITTCAWLLCLVHLTAKADTEYSRTYNAAGDDMYSENLVSVGPMAIQQSEYNENKYWFCYQVGIYVRQTEVASDEATLISPSGRRQHISYHENVGHEADSYEPRCFGPADRREAAQAVGFRNEAYSARKADLAILEARHDNAKRSQETKRQAGRILK